MATVQITMRMCTKYIHSVDAQSCGLWLACFTRPTVPSFRARRACQAMMDYVTRKHTQIGAQCVQSYVIVHRKLPVAGVASSDVGVYICVCMATLLVSDFPVVVVKSRRLSCSGLVSMLRTYTLTPTHTSNRRHQTAETSQWLRLNESWI